MIISFLFGSKFVEQSGCRSGNCAPHEALHTVGAQRAAERKIERYSDLWKLCFWFHGKRRNFRVIYSVWNKLGIWNNSLLVWV